MPQRVFPLETDATVAAARKDALRAQALELGVDAFGVAPIRPELRREYFLQWLAEGQHAEMAWMARDPERRLDPQLVLPEARSIIVCGFNYLQPEPERRGRIAKYALGKDYHNVLLKKLKRLCQTLREWGGINKPYVDTGPVLEKPIAEAAGLGWQAKNTLVINPDNGQYLFLALILTSIELPEDVAPRERCGSCTRCIDVCPTRAITAPFQLDARRCIAYLTIEHQGSIPLEFRRAMGDHLFGCDECLDVCPWNRWAQATREEKFEARTYPDLREMLAWQDEDFNSATSGTPIRRLKLPRWKRNICIVLGNTGTPADLPALQRTATDPDPMIAEHAQWAIEEIRLRNEVV
ncbi:MAG: tRNA epoxyqueuosine(34) reductase QueG [Verrucomicrobiota bacterium JB022]|nr:tRNA epoxyqueuosine(34) reductase QueG [Verrucomicrobiota bacterium JB022]